MADEAEPEDTEKEEEEEEEPPETEEEKDAREFSEMSEEAQAEEEKLRTAIKAQQELATGLRQAAEFEVFNLREGAEIDVAKTKLTQVKQLGLLLHRELAEAVTAVTQGKEAKTAMEAIPSKLDAQIARLDAKVKEINDQKQKPESNEEKADGLDENGKEMDEDRTPEQGDDDDNSERKSGAEEEIDPIIAQLQAEKIAREELKTFINDAVSDKALKKALTKERNFNVAKQLIPELETVVALLRLEAAYDAAVATFTVDISLILKLLRAIQSRLRDHADLVSMTGMQLTHRFNLRRNKHRLVFKQEELANALNFFSTNIDAVKVTLFECVICGDFEKLSDIVTHLISSTHLKKNVVDYDYRQSYLHDRVNELIYTMIDDREGMDEAPSVRGKWTLLHTAAYYNRVEMLSFFREHGGEACDALLATPVGRRKANALHLVAWREERHAQEALIWMLSFMGDKHLQGAMLQEDTEWCRPFDAAVIGGNRRNADLLRFNIDEVYGRKKLDESIMRVQQEKLFEQAQHDRQLQSLDTVGSKLVGKGIFWPTLVENVNGYGHEPREVLRYGMIRGWGLPFGESSAGLKEFSEEKYENIAVWHLEIEEEKCTTRSIFTSDRTKVANASTEIAVLLKAKIEAES